MKSSLFVVLAVSATALGAQYVLSPQGPGLSAGSPVLLASSGPHPRDMVTITFDEAVQVPAQSMTSIFDVPAGKWLVITRLEHRVNNGSSTNHLDMVQALGARIDVKIDGQLFDQNVGAYSTREFLQPVGLAFEPGSSVTLRNVNNFARTVDIHMIGYLVSAW